IAVGLLAGCMALPVSVYADGFWGSFLSGLGTSQTQSQSQSSTPILDTFTISGTVYYDKNCNDEFDATESGVPGVSLVIDKTTSVTHSSDPYPDPTTDGQGNYQGVYELSASGSTNYKAYMDKSSLRAICENCEVVGAGSSSSRYAKLYDLTGDTVVNFGVRTGTCEEESALQVKIIPIQTDLGADSVIDVGFKDTTPYVDQYTLVLDIDGNLIVKTLEALPSGGNTLAGDTNSLNGNTNSQNNNTISTTRSRLTRSAMLDEVITPTTGADGLVHVEIPYVFRKGGNIDIKATVENDKGGMGEDNHSAIVRDDATSDPCAPGVATVVSSISGDFNNSNTWGGKLPQADDWVMIRSGHKITFPTTPNANQDSSIKFKGLCVEKGAKIYTKSYTTLSSLPASFSAQKRSTRRNLRTCTLTEPYAIANCVTIPSMLTDPNMWTNIVPAGSELASDEPPSVLFPKDCLVEIPLVNDKAKALQFDELCLEEGAIFVTAGSDAQNPQFLALDVQGKATIDGEIIAGNGSNAPGVNFNISAGTFDCGENSKITAGDGSGTQQAGGAVVITSADSPTMDCKIKTGDGGSTGSEGKKGGFPGIFSIETDGSCDGIGGIIEGGDPGRSRHANLSAEDIDNLRLEKDELLNSINCFESGEVKATFIASSGIWNDPIHLVLGEKTNYTSLYGNVYLVTDKEGSIRTENLQPDAIKGKTITINSGTVDFSDAPDNAFVAEEEVKINVDNLVLPQGKQLTDFITAPKVTQALYKPIYLAKWSTLNQQIIKSPATTVAIPFQLNNLSSEQDAYNITLTDSSGWELCSLPSSVVVNPLRHTQLVCQMTLPDTYGVDNKLTIKATSQNDADMVATAVVNIKIPSKQTYTASGQVLMDGEPLANAAVHVTDQITYTDSNGYWEVPKLSNGEYTAKIITEGQVTEKLSFSVANADKQNIVLNVPDLGMDNGIVFQNASQTIISTEEGITRLPGSTLPYLDGESFRLTKGTGLTEDGQLRSLEVMVDQDGNMTFINPQEESSAALIISKDNEVFIQDGTVQISVDDDGNIQGVDTARPQYSVTVDSNGQITAKDETAPNMLVTLNDDGSFTGKDLDSGTEVTIDALGTKIVTHPDFPGMQAIVNTDNTFTVTDSLDANAEGVAVVFDLTTNDYQLINVADGTCYSEDNGRNVRLSWRDVGNTFKKVAGFASKAANFVADVVDKVTPITNFIGDAATIVGDIAGVITKNAPIVHEWANKVLNWACSNCHPFIANIASFIADTTEKASRFLSIVENVSNATKTITSITRAIPDISDGARKVAAWFDKFTRRAERSRTNLLRSDSAACDVWYQVDGNPPTQNQTSIYKASGHLNDEQGNPLVGVTIQVGDKV
ncbi:MAG: hypothetical protein VSS52_007995, partial [Thiotrichaceae bacterium]|nr:hypothetical protein [Thiotrichaceae bacterium]